jgi:hypothetical protein
VSNENPTNRGVGRSAATKCRAATMATTVKNKHNNTAAKCTIRYVLSFHDEKLGSVVHLVMNGLAGTAGTFGCSLHGKNKDNNTAAKSIIKYVLYQPLNYEKLHQ